MIIRLWWALGIFCIVLNCKSIDEKMLFGTEEFDLETTRGLIPQIINQISVLNQALRQSDVQDGKIILNTVGSYKPIENLFADIIITGTNVSLDLDGRSIVGTIKISGTAIVIKNGAIVAPPPLNMDQLGAAITVESGATNVLLKRCHIQCFDSGLTGILFDLVLSDTTLLTYELVATPTLFDSMPGRSALELKGRSMNIFDCSIIPGSSASTVSADAQQGGSAIVLCENASLLRILDCILVSGNGGNALSGNGGSAGHGIHVKDNVSHAEISKCTIFGTGQGGNGSLSGGNGGHGIFIESSADDVEVHDCRIRNTGLGGLPGGQGGKAIRDLVTTPGSYSIVFHNFAHNISNDIKFDLQGTGTEMGIASPNPPDNMPLNPLANIYVS